MERILTESMINIDDSVNRPFVISFHPEHLILASNSLANSIVNLWEINQENSVNLVNTLRNRNRNTDIINSNIAFHPSGHFMATDSERNNKVILWHIQPDFRNVNIVQTIEDHTRAIDSIAFNSTGNLMATGSEDYTVRLYHLTFTENNIQARCINTLTIHNGNGMIGCSIPSIIFHPTKNILATSCSLMGSFRVPSLKELKLWEISSNDSFESCNVNCMKSLTNSHKMKSIAFNSTGNLMASGDDYSKIKLWHITDDVQMTKCVKTIEKHFRDVYSVAFHPNQNILATGSSDRTTILWRISSDELFENWEVRCIIKLKGHEDYITSISFHKLYPFLATCSQDKIKIWKLNEDGEVEERGQVENNGNSNHVMNHQNRRQLQPQRPFANRHNIEASIQILQRQQPQIPFGSVEELGQQVENNSNSNNNNLSNINNTNNNISNLQQLTLEQLRELIIRRPIQNTNNARNYISQVQRLTRDQLIRLLTLRQQQQEQERAIQRRLLFNSNNENNQNPRQQQREERITIPENLLNPVKNSKNSCPNFNELYEFIMRQNLSGRLFFIYEGSNRKVIDFGGATRDVFDKILPAYTKKFFKEIEDNEDYVILKEDVDMDTLIRETDQLILLASASETKIFLKIDPILLSLLVETKVFKKYFTNNKRNRFSELYNKFNQYIEHRKNNDSLLKNKNNKRELIQKFRNPEINKKLKKEIEQEIRFRRFAINWGFINIKQFICMSDFIDDFYNINDSFITCKLKFDRETFVKRIKLFKKIYRNPVDYYLEPIPLEQYVRLSQNNESVSIINNSNDIIMNYPYLIPFLNFILGPESSDDDRILFVRYISGSSSYTGELKICVSSLTHVQAGRPYHATTCGKYLEIFINREQNRHNITVDAIRYQLLSDTGFGRA